MTPKVKTPLSTDPSIEAAVKNFLEQICAENFSIKVASVASVDGLPITSCNPGQVDEHSLAALVSSLVMLSSAASEEARLGQIQHLLVEGEEGRMVAMVVKDTDCVLCVMCSPELSLGHLSWLGHDLAEKLRNLVN
ncbi:MAG: roadblock/LC7 domain-containing protein [Candidatus Eremiobacteraeota bacterium]|nr:roadblock/LC7 domain-containing protein [Candidatus Eremiobacteraeota bacterium]